MNRIRALRIAKKMTQKELADRTGVTFSAISCYELDKRQADYETLRKLAVALDTTVDYLIGADDADRLLTGKDDPHITDFEGMPPEQIAEYFASLPGFPKMGSHPNYQPGLPDDELTLLSFYRDLNPQGREVLRNIAQSMATSGVYTRTQSSLNTHDA